MIPENLDEITFSAIEVLVAAGLRESRSIEFKRDAVGAKDEDKREFLADVSAMTNSVGGTLIFGVEESGGDASAVPGIVLSDPDAELRRLDAILRSGLEPRLPTVDIRWLPKSLDTVCLVVRVARSFIAPHRVIFRDHAKFYGRNSAGKYPLDVAEIRDLFLSADALVQRIRSFRRERLNLISINQSAIPVKGHGKCVLHIIPQSSILGQVDLEFDSRVAGLPALASVSGYNSQYTIDGLVNYVGQIGREEGVSSYALLCRNGLIEAVSSVVYPAENGPIIPVSAIEWPVLSRYETYIERLRALNIEPPYYLYLSLLGVRDCALAIPRRNYGVPYRCHQDDALFPEIIIKSASDSGEKTLRPVFDILWNVFGYQRSFSFGDDGQYVGERY